MNASSVVSWLAEAPWEYGLAGRWTALLILAWVAHPVLTNRDPRWRVLLWRSAAVGLATIVILTAAPPFVTWLLPRADSIVVPVSSSASVTLVADSLPVFAERPAQVVDRETSTARPPRRSESAKRPSGWPAVVPRKPAMTGPSLGSCLLAIWLLGVAVMAFRLGLCLWRVSRVVGRSTEVPTWVIEECRAVAAALGCRQAVRVVQTPEVAAPCLTSLVQPWLLLLEANCEETNRADLRAILAHELAHARRHDLVWNAVLHFWSILLWFHPLVWRIRAAHLAACDAVCDALAADLVGDVASYGQTLARLALRVAGQAPVPGLAMARTPDVLLRIEALHRRVFRSALPWRLIVPALLALGAVVILIGGFGINAADQPPARKDQPPARKATEAELAVENATLNIGATQATSSHRLSLRVLSAKTGEPLEKVSVSWVLRAEGEPRKETDTTGKEGTASIEWPPGITIRLLGLNVKKRGYVAQFLYWDGRNHAISLPESHEARLEPGVPISGVVQDEAGKPIVQASVTAMARATEGEAHHGASELGTTKTDEQGRWRIDDAPANVSGVSLHVHHPDYLRAPGAMGGGREWRTILSKGGTVKGRVVDGSGKPIKGAAVDIGDSRFGSQRKPVTTNEQGAYTLLYCDGGRTVVTAEAEGFAPQLREVAVADRGETTAPEIRLGKASVLRVKVVDRAGKPVAGAGFAADTWHGYRSLRYDGQVDTAGRFTWTSAPSDAVLFDIYKDCYMRIRLIPLKASDTEQVVTLDPQLVISGSVTDVVTGKPVSRFRVIRGVEQLEGRRQGFTWQLYDALEYAGGRYSVKFDFPAKAWSVRVEAAGYDPADARTFGSDEGAQVQDLRLKPAAGISGVVLLPDGRPAAGVQVELGTRENRAFVRGGVFQRNSNAERITTGPAGRLTVPRRAEPFLLVVAADAGFADATSDAFAKTGKLVLQPWGRIEGEVRIGRKPAAHQKVVYLPELPSNRVYAAFTGCDLRLMSSVKDVRDIPTRGKSLIIVAAVDNVLYFRLFDGQGKVVVDTDEKRLTEPARLLEALKKHLLSLWPPHVLTESEKGQVITVIRSLVNHIPVMRSYDYHFATDSQGRFAIDRVIPGPGQVARVLVTPLTNEWCEQESVEVKSGQTTHVRLGGKGRPVIGRVVLGGTPPEPVDWRTNNPAVLELPRAERLKATTPWRTFASGFDEDGRFRIEDVAPGTYELKIPVNLRSDKRTWGAPRATMGEATLRVTVPEGPDDQPVEIGDVKVKANALTWTQAHAGKMLEGVVTATYLIRAIPATFLIGPNGRVLAMNLRGAPLKEAVRKALNDAKLFPAAK